MIKKINQSKSSFYEKKTQHDKPLARLRQREREREEAKN